MSDFFLNLGMSWTWSKALPYLLFLIVGILVYFSFRSKLKNRVLKGVFVLMTVLPVSIYFLFNPIYEGDFSNNFRSAAISEDLRSDELTVIAIPNCPFCAESIQRLNKMAERTHVKRINFIVITSNSQDLKSYKEAASKKIHISKLADFEKHAQLTQGMYPTFIYASSPQMRIWSNDGFGVRAIDWLESEVSK